MGNDLIIRFYSSITCWLVFYFFDKKKKPFSISNKFEHVLLSTEGRGLVYVLSLKDSNSHRKKIVFFPSLNLDKSNLICF